MTNEFYFLASFAIGSVLAWASVRAADKASAWKKSIQDLADSSAEIKELLRSLTEASRENARASAEVKKSAEMVLASSGILNTSIHSLQEMIGNPNAVEEPALPFDPSMMQYSFERTQKDLIEQGLDPETAKYKAAEYELDRIADGDMSGISMSL